MYGNIMIVGASSGIGAAAAQHFSTQCGRLFTVSRRPAVCGEWLPTDLQQADQIAHLANQLQGVPIDALLYLGGTWETHAFTPAYDFETCSTDDMRRVVDVNLLAPMLLVQHLLPHFKMSQNPRIVLLGAALDSLDQIPYPEVANTASKYGLRGMVAALRQSLKPYQIGVTLLQPGYVATPEVLNDLAAANQPSTQAIPLSDLMLLIETILQLSRSTNVNEIDLPNM